MAQIEAAARENSQRGAWRLIGAVLAAMVLFGVLFGLLSFIFRPSLSPVEERLVGTWLVTWTEDMSSSEATYKANRTYVNKLAGQPEYIGRWEVVGDEIVSEYPPTDGIVARLLFHLRLNADRATVRFKFIDDDHIEVDAGDGNAVRYFFTRITDGGVERP